MKKYIVEVPEIHICPTEIEAESEDEARRLVAEGNGTPLLDELRYDYTPDGDEDRWEVTLDTANGVK